MRCVCFLLVGVSVLSAAMLAQTPANPSFEVASVKPSTSTEQGARFAVRASRLVMTNVPAGAVILEAYGLQDYFQLAGAPEWIKVDLFDIEATAPPHIPITSASLGAATSPLRPMLRSLLAERFKLVARVEQRQVPIYALVKARPDGKLGPNLSSTQTDCAALRASGQLPAIKPGERPTCGLVGRVGSLTGGGISISQLVTLVIAPRLGRPVVDRTQLTGYYDMTLTFRPDDLLPAGQSQTPSADANGPTFTTAIEEQLGLKLEPTKGLSEVLVIEHIERPTEN
jgi:uncharacterized protein (TIGR03435 family)